MLELGQQSPDLHRDLAQILARSKVEKVFGAGALMRHMFEALPKEQQGVWAQTSRELAAAVQDYVRGGDSVMVKGSLGSKMGQVVTVLQQMEAKDAKAG
jgi:UDP-N-acetylmuramoyl-tripeptide--D-alanyl-D-alanine ligase